MKTTTPYKHLLIALLVLGLGLTLLISRPVWLAPPWFQYTPLIYLLLMLTWLPLFLYGLFRLTRRRIALFFLLTIFILFGQCFVCMLLGPELEPALSLAFNPLPGMPTYFRCPAETGAVGAGGLTCQLCLTSSDVPETLYTYHLKPLPLLPLLWLTDQEVTRRSGVGIKPCEAFYR